MILALLSVQLVNKEQLDILQSLNEQALMQTDDWSAYPWIWCNNSTQFRLPAIPVHLSSALDFVLHVRSWSDEAAVALQQPEWERRVQQRRSEQQSHFEPGGLGACFFFLLNSQLLSCIAFSPSPFVPLFFLFVTPPPLLPPSSFYPHPHLLSYCPPGSLLKPHYPLSGPLQLIAGHCTRGFLEEEEGRGFLSLFPLSGWSPNITLLLVTLT